MLPFVLLDSLEQTLCSAGGTFYSLLEQLARGAATLVVTALWQGIAVAAILTAALRFLPRLAAAQRFALWLAALMALLGLPLLPSLASALTPALAAQDLTPATRPWFALDARWSLAIAGLWILATSWRAAGLAAHAFRLRRIWRSALPVEVPSSLEPALSGWSGRSFEVCTAPAFDRPCVIGFFRPRILIPEWLFHRLTPGELEQIILHECEHLRRRDDWTNLLQKVALALFPLNPALWFMEARLREEREMACDEAVVRITRAPRAYAACLTSLAERGLQRRAEALSLGVWQRRSELVRRVHGILRGRHGLSPVPARILAAALASGVLVVTLELARCPQLIAFEPPAPSAGHGIDAAQMGDALYPVNLQRRQGLAPYYALPAKAVVDALPAARVPHCRGVDAGTDRSAVGELRASSAAVPSTPAEPAALRRKKMRAHVDPADVQQFVVFTAWEQVEATADTGDRMADYDTGAPPAAPSDASKGSGGNTEKAAIAPASRVTVTQLVFRVLPRGSTATPKSGARTGISLPAAIPFGDGWLVLQL